MPDIVIGSVTKIQDQTIFFDCCDDRCYRSKRPLSFMDDQSDFVEIGDLVEFGPIDIVVKNNTDDLIDWTKEGF